MRSQRTTWPAEWARLSARSETALKTNSSWRAPMDHGMFVGCRRLGWTKLNLTGTRVALDRRHWLLCATSAGGWSTVYNMSQGSRWCDLCIIGGLSEQSWTSGSDWTAPLEPWVVQRVGITPPKGCLLYGPRVQERHLAQGCIKPIGCKSPRWFQPAIVTKFTGESARLIWNAQLCQGSSAVHYFHGWKLMQLADAALRGIPADREIHSVLWWNFNQMDGFDSLGQWKWLWQLSARHSWIQLYFDQDAWSRLRFRCQTNRLDWKFKIHGSHHQEGWLDLERAWWNCRTFQRSGSRNVCTEAGLAIRAERDYVSTRTLWRLLVKCRQQENRDENSTTSLSKK